MEQPREQMVVHGVSQLAAHGIRICLDHVTLDGAAAAAGIDLDAATELWVGTDPSDPPEERFREAVAVRVLREQPGIGDTDATGGGGLTETLIAVSAMVEAMPSIEGLTPVERGRWLRRAVRAGAEANQAMADRSQLWRSYVAISTAVLSQPNTPPALSDAWRHGEETAATRYLNLYSVMAAMFGLRLRYCYTWPQFTTAVSATAEGLMIRSNVKDDVRSVERHTGPDGDIEIWTLFGVCLEGLIQQFFEPDDDAVITSLEHETPPRVQPEDDGRPQL